MTEADSRDTWLALDPRDRAHVVVLDADELSAIKRNESSGAKLKRIAKGAVGAGSGAGMGAAAAGQIAVRGAAMAASGAVAAPLVVFGGAAGLGAAWLLDRGSRWPAGITLVDPMTASAVTSPSGPLKLNKLYNVHPARPDFYIPDSEYKRFILDERGREAERFFLHCGACRIELTVQRGEDAQLGADVGYEEARLGLSGKLKARRVRAWRRSSILEAPAFKRPRRLDPDKWSWAVYDDLLDVHRKRREFGIRTSRLETTFRDERHLDASAKAKLVKLAKIEVAAAGETISETTWLWDVTFPA